MSIRQPYIPQKFGALDSAAVADGRPLTAHVLKTIVGNGNWLVSEGVQFCSLWWPLWPEPETVERGSGVARHIAGMAPPRIWRRWLGPMPLPTFPGHRTAEVRWTARIDSGNKILIQHVTRRAPFRSNAQVGDANILEVEGNGTYKNYNLAGLPIDEGPFDIFEIWMRAHSNGPMANTSKYGGPATGGFDGGVEATRAFDGAAYPTGWNSSTSGNPSLDWGGHEVIFEDDANQIITRREITRVDQIPILGGGAGQLTYGPPLSDYELHLINGTSNQYYTIRKLPEIDVSCLVMRTEDRTR